MGQGFNIVGQGGQMAHINAAIPVLFFKEGNKIVAYSPALDISSCGDTEEHARARFAEAASIFLDELQQMGTLAEVLEECGWCRVSPKHAWVPPVYGQIKNEPIKIPA
jgi:hypothetical protein